MCVCPYSLQPTVRYTVMRYPVGHESRMKQSLRHKLRRLYSGGLAAIVVLVVAYALIQTAWQILGNYSLLTLIILCALLLQGSVYWWLKLRQIEKVSRLDDPRIISYLYALNLLLLLIYPAVLVISLLNDTIENSPDVLIGGVLFILALITFVHYSLVKLVRSDTDRIALTRRRQVTARFMRELQRSELRKKAAR